MTTLPSLSARPRWRPALAVVALSVASMTLLPAGPAGASGTHPTLSQIESDVATTLATNKVPDLSAATPGLSSAPLTNEGRIPSACATTKKNSVFPVDPWKYCAFGDKHAKRTIYLFGDDAAAQWIPAYRAIGTALKWRVVITTKLDCSPWSYGTSADGGSCRRFVDDEIAMADADHPAVIVPMGEKVVWRGSKGASVRYLVREMQGALVALKPSHARVILMEPIPAFVRGYTNWTPQICMRTYRDNLRPCEAIIYNEAVTSTASLALDEIAFYNRIPLEPTRDLFCSGTHCALYVTTNTRTWLVYKDATTINLDYANFVSGALATMITPRLR